MAPKAKREKVKAGEWAAGCGALQLKANALCLGGYIKA